MARMGVVLVVILWAAFCLTGAVDEAETLYKKAVAVEYESGLEKALPYYKALIEKYPDSGKATQAREKIIEYRKEIGNKQHKTGESKRNRTYIEAERRRRRQTDEKIASFRLSNAQAYRLVMDDYNKVRGEADFYLSTRADLTILEVKMKSNGAKKIASILVYGRGYFYDLNFTVVYGLTYDIYGEFTPKLIEVKRGRVTGLSDLVLQFLGKKE